MIAAEQIHYTNGKYIFGRKDHHECAYKQLEFNFNKKWIGPAFVLLFLYMNIYVYIINSCI